MYVYRHQLQSILNISVEGYYNNRRICHSYNRAMRAMLTPCETFKYRMLFRDIVCSSSGSPTYSGGFFYLAVLKTKNSINPILIPGGDSHHH